MRLFQAVMFAVVVVVGMGSAEAALTPVSNFGANPGALDMFEYVPAGLPAGAPLVVVMHGCTQSATAMETAGWNALADAHHFAVVYPQQRSANQPLSCFTWYQPADIARKGGEAESVIQMVDHAIAAHGLDAGRVYVTGLSAGAAFTAVMLAAYPDRFAAGSIMSGLPYQCATDQTAATGCEQMSAQYQKTPAAWAALVKAADPGFVGSWPRVQIWQGASDFTVYPANATELIKQWTAVWGTDQTADATDTISAATRTQYKAGGTVAVELYVVSGMGHAIATGIDPSGACPAGAGAYFSDQKICSTLRAAEFFGLLGTVAPGPDTVPPTLSISSPKNGDAVSGQVAIDVTAHDDVGVAMVEVSVDGVALPAATSAPYQFTWDAGAAAAGSHAIIATASDAAGNHAIASATVTIGAGSGGPGGADQGGGGCAVGGGGGLGGIVVGLGLALARRRRRR